MRELPFTLACGFAIICLLLPAAWHVRSKNSGTLLYLAWSLTGNLIYLVNAIVWAGNIDNPAPIWCDICGFSRYSLFSTRQTDFKQLPSLLSALLLGFHALLFAFSVDFTPSLVSGAFQVTHPR